MRLALIVAALAVFATVGGLSLTSSSSAQAAPLIPCYGAPAGYVSAFDAKDGALDAIVSYPEPRVFLEVQSQLQPPGETSRHHFEHIHIGGCYPYAETWMQASDARTFHARYVFHNVADYNVSAVASSFVDANNSGGGYVATAAQKAELEAAMDASANSTQTVFQGYTMKNIGTSCRKTFRAVLNTVRANPDALVDEWFAATQWTSYINYPGQPVCNPEFQQDQARGRSWILPNGGYLYGTLLNLPIASQMGAPASSLDFTVSGTGQPFSWYIDPDFHTHDPNSPDGDNLGIAHADLGQVDGQLPVSIPLDTVPAGDHRLVVITVRGIQSSVVVIPFKVAGTC